MKVPVFYMFYVISQPFFEDIDLKFCTHIHQPMPSNILSGFFENFDFEGSNFEKEKENVKKIENFDEFSKFSKFEIAVL